MDGNSKCGDEEMGVVLVHRAVRWELRVFCWSTEQSDGSDKCGGEEMGFMLVHRAVRWEWQVW